MTLDELREVVMQLQYELENVGDEDHNKSASLRARKILIEIKKATPQLRKDLVELDKR